MAKRRTWRWVTREQNPEENADIGIWSRATPQPRQVHYECFEDGKPSYEYRDWGQGKRGMADVSICPDEFEKLTGLTIPTDHPVKVEFSARIIE